MFNLLLVLAIVLVALLAIGIAVLSCSVLSSRISRSEESWNRFVEQELSNRREEPDGGCQQ